LDAGEAEAIALGVETDAAVLLMDERYGRDTASHFDIPHFGLTDP
jgi:predicted nucleic acid-binding protein